MNSSRLVATTIIGLAVALSACNPDLTSPRVVRRIRAFVESEPIQSPQNVQILHGDLAAGIVLFALWNGPPQDCPSGCFFDRALGVHAEGRVGWWNAPYGPGPWTMFDVRATDASLFDHAALSRIKAKLDALTFLTFAYFLGCDSDTPSATRDHLAAETGDARFPRCAVAP